VPPPDPPLLRPLWRRPRVALLAALLVGVGAAVTAARLDLRTAFSELLPEDDAGVVALRRTQERMGDLSLLLVGIRSPDMAANERYAKALTDHLRGLPRSVCEVATYHLRDIQAFFQDNRWLYASEADLEDVRDRLRKEIGRRKNPLFVDLGGDDAEERAALEARLRRPSPLEGRFADGLFRNPGGDTLWVAALPPGGLMAEKPGEALLAATQAFIAAHPPASFHPAMDVQPAGPLVTPVRNREALERDLVWVAALCGLFIPLSIGLYFGRPRAVLFVGAPAVLATLLAYATAYLAFGYVTTVTSFLVSFVMGNGTNYAIVLLSHYEEHRRAGATPEAAAREAVGSVWRSTGVAALASALSYFSLLVTGFRGFSQFGLIGGAGSLFAWLSTFTVMPALLVTWDPRGPRPAGRRGASPRLLRLATAVERTPGLLLVAALVATALAVVGAARFGLDAFEYDFRKLTAQGLIDARVRAFDRDKDHLFGRWPQPTVIVTDRPEDVMAARAAIRRADQAATRKPVIGQMFSVEDLLPGSPEEQERKLRLLAHIRRAVDDPALAALDESERRELERLRAPESLRVLGAEDLPALARRPFTEADGTVGRVLLLYPPETGLSIWDGKALLQIASVIQRVPLPDGRVLETSGSAVIFAAMIRSIVRDGPRATAASLAAVVLLVLLRVRPWRAAAQVLVALLVGVAWMVGVAGWAGMKITFLNFIALPFIFGVGVEYAIHVVTEQRQHGNVSRTLLSAGGPVALCSWSAIVGYGSLLAARNGALRGLGALATLGEVMCLAAAVLVLPAYFAWIARRRIDRAA
jgi:predicted RND superfamily exporter protein